MQKLEKTEYGFRITSTGILSLSGVESFKSELEETLRNHKSSFSLIVDLRGLIPPEPGVVEVIKQIMRICAEMDILRAAIITSSPVVKAQQNQMSFDSLTAAHDRTIDANKYPDWEERALAWVKDAVEPEGKLNVI